MRYYFWEKTAEPTSGEDVTQPSTYEEPRSDPMTTPSTPQPPQSETIPDPQAEEAHKLKLESQEQAIRHKEELHEQRMRHTEEMHALKMQTQGSAPGAPAGSGGAQAQPAPMPMTPQQSQTDLLAQYVQSKMGEEGSEEIPGGLAAGKPDSKYPPEELKRGIEVEKEHTPDSAKAKEIAKDHLEEHPEYYTALDAMEAGLEAKKEAFLSKISAVLTEAKREKIPAKAFALPGDRYPIHDLAHAKNALARVSQHGTPSERATVRKKVYAKYPELKESFEERSGESPTSKENVKKEELNPKTAAWQMLKKEASEYVKAHS